MFITCKCRHCNSWQVKEVRKTLKNSVFTCMHCKKSTKLVLKSKAGRTTSMTFYEFDNPISATLMCKKLKLHQNTGSTEFWKSDLNFIYGSEL